MTPERFQQIRTRALENLAMRPAANAAAAATPGQRPPNLNGEVLRFSSIEQLMAFVKAHARD